jgi:lipopolysaccharide heptosyltransferase II
MARKKNSASAAPLRRTGQYGVYLVFRGVELLLWLLPLPVVALLGQAVGALGYLLAGSYRRLAQNNLRIAFGKEKTETQRRSIARQHFRLLGANFFCGLKLPLMREADIEARVTVTGKHHGEALAAQAKPLLFAVSHLSCWELLTQVPSLFLPPSVKPASVFQPLANPFINAHLHRQRERLGYVLFDRSDGFNGPLKHLRTDKGALGVLVDQHAGDSGLWCPFFDRLASTTSLPALMARRSGTPLLPIAVKSTGLARWHLTIHPPISPPDSRMSVEKMTATLNLVLEQIIREAPENWFWVHNRWKTPQPDFLLSGYKRGIAIADGYDSAQLQPFEILLRSPNWLGDACMTFPAVRALKAGRPDVRLTVFCQGKLAELWRSLGVVDEVITKDGKAGLLSVARSIRQSGRRYDAGILFTNSTRSTLEFWLAGNVARLVGFAGSLRSALVEQITPEPRPGQPPEHQTLRYLRLAAHCGAAAEKLEPLEPPTPAGGQLHIGICAGAEYGPAKRWPLEKFAETIRLVSAQVPEAQWQFFGAPGEKAMGEQLSSMVASPHENLVGKTSMTELIAKLQQCRLLITNDTGTMHLAVALGVPTVSIFGSTEPILTGPLGPQHQVIRHHLPCSPCFKRECPFDHYDCMQRVQPEQVAAAAVRGLLVVDTTV